MNIVKVLLFTLTLSFSFPNLVFANTDPQNATVSATATIPSTTPTTNDVTAPPPPILISPSDGAITNQTRPEFVWHQSSDPNGNTVFYTVLLNGTATFLGVSNSGNSQKSNYIAHLGDGNVYLTPTLDLPAGEYNWQVNAYDLSGNISHSTTWHFTIDLTPPFLTLKNIDHQYIDPILTDNPTFEITGPKDVTLSLITEPYATISIRISSDHDRTVLYSRSYPTDASGLAEPYFHLQPGRYSVDLSSFDRAGYTTTLPIFTLLITESAFAQLLPPTITQIIYQIPPTIPSLTASIAPITTRVSLAPYLLILLAFLISSLLILFWYRIPNILIIDQTTGKPYRSLILYHSIPTSRVHGILATHKQPIYYFLTPARAYIPNLNRYSTLTIRIGNNTHVLSLSVSKRFYTIKI